MALSFPTISTLSFEFASFRLAAAMSMPPSMTSTRPTGSTSTAGLPAAAQEVLLRELRHIHSSLHLILLILRGPFDSVNPSIVDTITCPRLGSTLRALETSFEQIRRSTRTTLVYANELCAALAIPHPMGHPVSSPASFPPTRPSLLLLPSPPSPPTTTTMTTTPTPAPSLPKAPPPTLTFSELPMIMAMKRSPLYTIHQPTTWHRNCTRHSSSTTTPNLPRATLLTTTSPLPPHLPTRLLTNLPSLALTPLPPFHPLHLHILPLHSSHHHASTHHVRGHHLLTHVQRFHHLSIHMHYGRDPGSLLPAIIAHHARLDLDIMLADMTDDVLPGAALPTLADIEGTDIAHLQHHAPDGTTGTVAVHTLGDTALAHTNDSRGNHFPPRNITIPPTLLHHVLVPTHPPTFVTRADAPAPRTTSHDTPVSPPASVHPPSDRDSSVASPLVLLPGPGDRPPPQPTPPASNSASRPTTPPQAFQPPPAAPFPSLHASEAEELRLLRLQLQQQQQAAHHLQQQALFHSSFTPFLSPFPFVVPALHAGNLRAFRLKLLLRLHLLRPDTRFPRPGPLMTSTWIGSRSTN